MALVLLGYTRCKLTQAAFEAHGHDVWTCDLLPAPGKHLQMDIWAAIASKSWDFGLFHPMCTFLTVSAAWAYADPDFIRWPGVGYHQKIKAGTLTGAARRDARDEAIDNFRRLDALPFPNGKENPATSFLNKAIRPPDQVIHPHQYGDDASKATGLWLSGDVPLLVPTADVAPRMVSGRPRWANQTDSGQNRLSPSDTRWLERSATYPGIAAAIGDQWGRWLNNRMEKAA